ncbi:MULTISPECIES: acyl carrier protein [Winslowiella]|uniref:acyl carrier protein n=1 Tax=Winslowiella TaxID=2997349 RepID=UPI0028BD2CD4|nr:acyl carrier protein [Winslowiella toletana]WNN42510.1 acyl carrier protein [Winslowiella toletana]
MKAADTNTLQAIILSIWKQVLNNENIALDDDLIGIGGQSLDALKIANECQRQLGKPVNMVRVLRSRTVAGLTESLSKA